jgi:hypothetical protein
MKILNNAKPKPILLIYLFIYLFRQLGQGHHNSICQLLWALLPNPPCQLSLWEETGVPGENPRLSAERWLLLFSHEDWVRESTHRGLNLRPEPAASEVKDKCANHLVTEAPTSGQQHITMQHMKCQCSNEANNVYDDTKLNPTSLPNPSQYYSTQCSNEANNVGWKF